MFCSLLPLLTEGNTIVRNDEMELTHRGSFTVEHGEMLVLTGVSGSGKSSRTPQVP